MILYSILMLKGRRKPNPVGYFLSGIRLTEVNFGKQNGYIHHTYWALKFYAVHGEGLGHLRINKAGFKQKSKADRVKYHFSREETAKIIKLIRFIAVSWP